MFTKYQQLRAIAENCDEGALYGAVVTLRDTNPEWRRDKELVTIMKTMAERLEARGWEVHLGLTGRDTRFSLLPPNDERSINLSYPLNAMPRHQPTQTNGQYFHERRKQQ